MELFIKNTNNEDKSPGPVTGRGENLKHSVRDRSPINGAGEAKSDPRVVPRRDSSGVGKVEASKVREASGSRGSSDCESLISSGETEKKAVRRSSRKGKGTRTSPFWHDAMPTESAALQARGRDVTPGKKRPLSASRADDWDDHSTDEDDDEPASKLVATIEGETVNLSDYFKKVPKTQKSEKGAPPATDDAAMGVLLDPGASAQAHAGPTSTWEQVKKAEAKRSQLEAEKRLSEVDNEGVILELVRDMRTARNNRLTTLPPHPSGSGAQRQASCSRAETGVALAYQARTSCEVIDTIAKKSGHLSGPYVKSLYTASAFLGEVVGELLDRNTGEEVELLQKDNHRLQAKVADLEREMKELRAEVQNMSCPQPVADADMPEVIVGGVRAVVRAPSKKETANAELMRQMGDIINARFAALEDRLLPEPSYRPSLRATSGGMTSSPQGPLVESVAGASGMIAAMKNKPALPLPGKATIAPAAPGKSKRQRKGKKSMAAREAAESHSNAAPAPLQPARPVTAWTDVVKARPPPLTQLKKTRPPRIRVPKTAAVVVTLQPDAVKSGLTYQQVLVEAQQKIELATLDVKIAGFRQSMTGARIYEVAGENKADILADRLREVVSPEVARITRPTKTAAMRVMGLDDTATSEVVARALAKVGECAVQDVRTGDVKRNPSGLGTIWACCPVAAAKKIVGVGRVLVGWVSARVSLLEPRPMHCFRCLQRGHVGCVCKADVDRSGLCFRCSQSGHKAAQCSNQPHCVLCEAAGRPAGHSVGASACADKPKGGKRQPQKRSSMNISNNYGP